MTLLDFIDNIAQQALEYPHVYITPGHNGPYFHPETPVRNKGHWLVTFCKLYEWTGRELYKSKAAELAEFIVSKEARPHGYSFYHRNAPKKDKCNGLVGQAWTFEALAQAAKTFGDHGFNKLAEEVFLQHHFNQKHALWNILEIDGKILPIDNAFNHQLWFAAGISLVNSKNAEIHRQLTSFLDQLFHNVTTLDNGLIYHEFDFEPEDPYQRRKDRRLDVIKQKLKLILSPGKSVEAKVNTLTPAEKKEKLWHKMKNKSIGYHSFNTYAFALLKQQYPAHPIWEHGTLKNIVKYLFTDEYIQGVKDNQYSFAYNPPGFEVPFSIYVLQKLEESHFCTLAQNWVNQQLAISYNQASGLFDQNNQDPVTLTARIYEVTRLDQHVLNRITIENKFL